MTKELNLLSKITVSKCHGKLDRDNLPKGNFLRVVGIATGTKSVADKFKPGEFAFGITGDIVAINTLSGEEYRSGVCYMPATAQNLVVGALGGNPDGVEFAFDIGVKKAENPVGYEYTIKPVIKPKESNAMAALLGRVQEEAPLALAAPEGAGKKAK